MKEPQKRITGVGFVLNDFANGAIVTAHQERWSICVIVGGEEVCLVKGRPGRKLVIDLQGMTPTRMTIT